MDLISGETIAIDSFKIRAQNSLKNNFNQKKIDRHLDYIDSKIAEYEQQLDENDELENNQKEEIEDKIQWQQEKKKEYQSIEKELKESGESQISKTDPDAKSVILHRNVVNVGYNVQAGCDGTSSTCLIDLSCIPGFLVPGKVDFFPFRIMIRKGKNCVPLLPKTVYSYLRKIVYLHLPIRQNISLAH